MSRKEIIDRLGQYFATKELVCDHVYSVWGERSWQFLDTQFMHCLLVMREEILKVPMTCNTSTAHQRGLRCNMCEMVQSKTVPYLSSHLMGKAGDFTVKGMSAEEARVIICQNADLLPCNIRLEADVTWLHFDVMQQWEVDQKVYIFKG